MSPRWAGDDCDARTGREGFLHGNVASPQCAARAMSLAGLW